MSEIRDRTKRHFPMVLLTLLSIVQALALELLWSHVLSTDYLFEQSLTALNAWIQLVATFLGLVLIWVVYASNAMRFRWVPVTSDSVYPFLIGVLQFMLVETLGPGETGQWLVILAVIYAVMVRVSHTTMKRARRDPDNDAFFRDLPRATMRDFYSSAAIAGGLGLAGVYLIGAPDDGVIETLALVSAGGILAWQFYESTRYWKMSVGTAADNAQAEQQ
jgi:hypothetical protein